MAYTIKPLGKLYTLKDVVNNIVLWLKKEIQKDLDPDFVKVLINLAVLDVAEILSGAGNSDYSKDVNINDSGSNWEDAVFGDASFQGSTSIVTTTTPHGLVAATAIGKRILLWANESLLEGPEADPVYSGISSIVSITDTTHFVIKPLWSSATPVDINFSILPAHSSETIDLSVYPISHITKVHDSVNNEVVETGDKEFDNIYRFPTKQNKCFFNVRGQSMFLKKGTDVSVWGELTMTYNSYPQKTTEEDDTLDIRDFYAPLVILKAKNFCLEHLQITPPESLTNAIDNKSREIRENIQKEKEIANMKNHGK